MKLSRMPGAQMRNFGLEKAELVVRQANKTDEINVASLQQSYLELLEEKNRRIGEMTAQLKRYRVTNVEVDDISREVGVMMENIKAISLMKGITFDVAGTPLDTTLVWRRYAQGARRFNRPEDAGQLAEDTHQGG